MSRSGNVWDNAAMESFFSSLKTERTARKVYRTRNDARADVFDYIERFYNRRRRHSTLGHLSHRIGSRPVALKQAAAVNPGDKFELVFKNLFEAQLVERMDQNEEIFARSMNDKSFQKVVTGWLSSKAYRKLRTPNDGLPANPSADSAEGSLSVGLASSDSPV